MKKTTEKNDGKRKLQPPVAIFNGGDAEKILQPPVGEKLAPVVREIGKPIGIATNRIMKHLPKALQGQLLTPDQIATLLEKV